METFSNLLVAALATWQAVEIWRHGAIFATRRASMESAWRTGFRGWLSSLLLCPFCLSVWVGWLTWIMTMSSWTFWLVAGLAASRLANIANDSTHHICRTPNRDFIPLSVEIDRQEEEKALRAEEAQQDQQAARQALQEQLELLDLETKMFDNLCRWPVTDSDITGYEGDHGEKTQDI